MTTSERRTYRMEAPNPGRSLPIEKSHRKAGSGIGEQWRRRFAEARAGCAKLN